ncbi:MAG: biotin synthase BioB [Planctomycetaceae bacterium]|jgi:biotin synthase|nr:biotin synthase BioB [Planctomycetaceae bacterium]
MLSSYDIEKMPLTELMHEAEKIRANTFDNCVDLCAIINIKSGHCSMNCRFCAQSGHYKTGINVYPLRDTNDLISSTRTIWQKGVHRVGWVASGCKLSSADLDNVLKAADELFTHRQKLKSYESLSADNSNRNNNETEFHGELCCASFGQLDTESLKRLKASGFSHYHHNLETSERFYPSICTTQRWQDRLATLNRVLELGWEVCSGGIFGLGETWEDRIQLAQTLKKLDVKSVPLNFYNAIEGTPLSSREPLSADECLRIVALFRIILQKASLRICGGRPKIFGERVKELFHAGADSLMTGNYATTNGISPEHDRKLISEAGFFVTKNSKHEFTNISSK